MVGFSVSAEALCAPRWKELPRDDPMSVSGNRRSEVQAAAHLVAIEKFADFASQSAAGLRT